MIFSLLFTLIIISFIVAVGIVTFVFLKQPFGRFVAFSILGMVAFAVILTELVS